MIDLDAIAAALFERVGNVSPVEFATRYKLGIEQLPQYPACIVGLDSANVTPSHGLPSQWRIAFDIAFVDRVEGPDEEPEARISEWLVNLQAALVPDEGARALTLGGLVEHAWISGPIDVVPPSSQFPWVECWVRIEVLAVG